MIKNEFDFMIALEMKKWERRRWRENNFINLIQIEVLEEGFHTKGL